MTDENEIPLKRVDTGLRTRPHRWQDCTPAAVDPDGKPYDPSNPINRAARKIFNSFGQLDKIRFHQATCENKQSPYIDATMRKFIARFEAETEGMQ